jgi:hypothetical protein
MANADAPRGFTPIRQLGSAPHSGGVGRYYIGTGDSNNIFIGDPVDLGGTGNTAGTAPSVVRATAGSGGYVVGVVVGIENLTSDNLSRTYRPASTEGYLLVADNPNEEFEIQEDSDAETLAITAIGSNIDFIIGTGNTTTGISATELNSNTCDTTNTLQCRVMRLVDRPDNEIGAQAKWIVKFNLHRYSAARTEGMSE